MNRQLFLVSFNKCLTEFVNFLFPLVNLAVVGEEHGESTTSDVLLHCNIFLFSEEYLQRKYMFICVQHKFFFYLIMNVPKECNPL